MNVERGRKEDAHPLLAGELSWKAASYLLQRKTGKAMSETLPWKRERRKSFYFWLRGKLLPKQSVQG